MKEAVNPKTERQGGKRANERNTSEAQLEGSGGREEETTKATPGEEDHRSESRKMRST